MALYEVEIDLQVIDIQYQYEAQLLENFNQILANAKDWRTP